MINIISDKVINLLMSINLLKKDEWRKFDLYFRNILFKVIILKSLFTISEYFGLVNELLIITLVLNLVVIFTGGHHFPSLERCMAFTIPYVTILSAVAKYTTSYPLHILFVSIVLSILIIKNIPNIPQEEMMKENKSEWFYINNYINITAIFYIISFVIVLSNTNSFNFIITSIAFGNIGVSILLITNKKEDRMKYLNKMK